MLRPTTTPTTGIISASQPLALPSSTLGSKPTLQPATPWLAPSTETPTPGYRGCMHQLGWKFLSVTRLRVPTPPSNPNFSSNAKLKPGHFIDSDSGMDCENIGGASVCGPPSGTVRYYDPEQGLNCTRQGLVSVCSNM
jgi:hypothetical protein